MNISSARPGNSADTLSTRASSTPRKGWIVTFLLLAFMLINFADKAVLGLAAKPIMRDLGLSPSEYGLLHTGFYFLFSISAVVVGFVANRVATKWLLLAMGAVWAVAMVMPMVGGVFAVLMASRVILGAAEGPANPIAMHAAHKWFPNEKRSVPSALLNVGAGVGVAVAAPLLTTVITTYGWRWAFFSLFAVGMVWVLLWALLGEEGQIAGTDSMRDSQRSTSGSDEPRVPYRRILLSGTWLGGFLAGFAAYWGLSLLVAWVPAYLQTVLGYSPQAAGSMIVLPWVLGAVFIFGQGVLTQSLMRRGVSSRLARGVLGGVGVVIAGLAMVLFPVLTGGVQIALITVAFSIGGIVFAIGVTVTSEICPTRQRGAVLSITVALVTTAGLVGPYATGRIIESASTAASGYALAFTITGVLLLIGGLLAVVFVRPERDAQRLGLRPHTVAP